MVVLRSAQSTDGKRVLGSVLILGLCGSLHELGRSSVQRSALSVYIHSRTVESLVTNVH